MERIRLTLLEARALLPERRPDTHKGSYGRLLVIAGSARMTGAAILCCRAAYRSGVGLAEAAMPEGSALPLQVAVPEAILRPYSAEIPYLSFEGADAVVFGPGIGTETYAADLFSQLLQGLPAEVPLLVDADGLNLLALHPELAAQLRARGGNTLLTPHPGEASRLLGLPVGEVKALGEEAALRLAGRFRATVILKTAPAVCVTEYARVYENPTGNNGMATAGSGDVLAGVCGALLAQGLSPEEAAVLGMFFHGEAGDRAAQQIGKTGLMASDIIENLRLEKSESWNSITA